MWPALKCRFMISALVSLLGERENHGGPKPKPGFWEVGEIYILWRQRDRPEMGRQEVEVQEVERKTDKILVKK